MATLDIRGTVVGETATAIKAPCLVATTGSTVTLAGTQSIDGVIVGTNFERVLVKDQTIQTQNGIYIASTGPWVLAADFANNNNVILGTLVLVVEGATNSGKLFQQTCADNPIVIGSSSIAFVSLANATAEAATSTTSVTIGTGTQTFSTQAGKAFSANQWLLIQDVSNSINQMLGQILSYTGTSLIVNVVATGGAGTYSGWTIVLTNSAAAAGYQPPIGSGNVTGPGSSTPGHFATFSGATGKIIQDGGAAGLLAALSSITAQYLTQSTAGFGTNMLNGAIVATVSTGALTFTIQTLAGNTPSSSDPVWFIFRNAAATSGIPLVIEVSSALSVTVPASSTLGFINSTPGRIWIVAVNNAGTVSLAVINCVSGTNVFALGGWPIASITAFSAGANNAQVFYGASTVLSLPYSVLGYVVWETGNTLSTAGVWSATPSRVELYRPGVPLPGQTVQIQYNSTGAAATLNTNGEPWGNNTVPTSSNGTQIMSQAITPTSSANILEIEAQAFLGIVTAARLGLALFQDSGTSALAAVYASFSTGEPRLKYRMQAGTLSSTTMKIQGGSASATSYFNAEGGTQVLNGTMNSFVQVTEMMA